MISSYFRFITTAFFGVAACLSGYASAGEDPFRIQGGVSVICVEADTGAILYEKGADIVRPPASMIKLMLMLLVAEGLEQGDWTLDTVITASRHAQGMGGTQVYLAAGEKHPLRTLMHAVAVASANDAAMAVAEQLWGSEEAYLARMNERAQELGMTRSEFHSVHGLPPSRGEQPDKTTARDMATLGRACMTEPQVREWVAMKRFAFRTKDNLIRNTNELLWRMENCDGLKTGYIRAAGFCVTATAANEDFRLIVVVMGHKNKERRFTLAEDLFEYGFLNVRRAHLVKRGETSGPTVPVENCETPEITLGVEGDIWVTASQEEISRMEVKMVVPEALTAPMKKGATVGEAQLSLDGTTLQSVPLILPVDLEGAGWLWKLQHRIDSFAEAE